MGDASTLRLLAAMMRTQGPCPERPFAVLTNDIGRLDCWKRVFLLDGDDSALRRVQELLGVRYDGRDASRADLAAIRSPAGIIMAANALVRACPSAAGAPLGLALKGDALPAAGAAAPGGWLPVFYRGRRGWVAKRFVK